VDINAVRFVDGMKGVGSGQVVKLKKEGTPSGPTAQPSESSLTLYEITE
jgi:hypothetical protein